jgi:hypothetical protein
LRSIPGVSGFVPFRFALANTQSSSLLYGVLSLQFRKVSASTGSSASGLLRGLRFAVVDDAINHGAAYIHL